MIVVDSSGWIEFLTDGALADAYAARLRNLPAIVTSVIVLYEVYKRLKRDRTRVVAITSEIALTAADLSLEPAWPWPTQ